ncbi:hypothetical protein ACNAW0_26560 [Micromonospora sp. SL1-18]|uniref:hypothetical protein n=1 Tax=Micromonospora sp. SL1-18 TaxID=3399128 RepID=UPI003A4DAD63
MRAPSRPHRRIMALVMVPTLGCGAAVGLTAAPAAAAVAAPTDLKTAGQPCAAAAPGPYLSPGRLNDARAVALRGTFSRTDTGSGLQADFQVWDVADPEHPQQWLRDIGERSDEVYVQLEDETKQLDGVTYAWRVRVLDGAEASPWSSTCHYTVDRSGGPAPVVTSTEYPAGDWDNANGAIGVPGAFTLTSAADDTVSYRYRFYSAELSGEYVESTVDAEGLGGPATVRWTPRAAGHHSVTVYAVDRAGNRSEAAYYEFYVKETRPSIFSSAYPDWGSNLDYNVGVSGAFELSATVPDTVSFGWRIDEDGPSGMVPADAKGRATAMIAPTRAGRQTLYVHSVTRDGTTHAPRAYEFLVDNAPTFTTDTSSSVTLGSSLTFHLAPRAPRVEAYLYWPEYSGLEQRPVEKTTVPARADGTAVFTWTATETGVDGLRIQSRSADGTLSEPRWAHVSVDGAVPMVTRTGGTDLGTPAAFTVRSRMANVVEYVAKLNHDEATKQVLKPAADGSATFSFTPTRSGYNYVTVVARNAAGVQTEEGGTSWSVTDGPGVTSPDFPATGSGRLAPGTFSFTPHLPGTTAYQYAISSGSYTTIAARPDGTATLPWTPAETGRYQLTVRSVTADGTRSMWTLYNFTVVVGAATVTSVAPATVPGGSVRTITIRGTGLHPRDVVQVTPATGQPLAATVKTVSADGTTMTAEVNLASAPTGRAGLALYPYGAGQPVVLAGAFTIAPPPAMSRVKLPTISGTLAVGGTVKATPGEWTPTATAYQYQWSANGIAIKGATAAALIIPAALLGKRLTVTVTATRPGYSPTKATSAASAAVAKGKAPRATKRPKIIGTPRVGRTVRVDVGAWSPKADSYRYEWRINGKLIRSATGSKLKLTSSMRNKRLTVTVIAKKAGYADGRATSAALTVRR